MKHIIRTVKLIISLLVFFYDFVTGWVLSLFGIDNATCVILYYHTVYAKEKEAFARQMDDLLRWTKPIALNEIGLLKSGGRYCSVTFDDGFACILKNALPLLSTRHIPATLFVPSGFLGQKPSWLREGHTDHNNVVMTKLQLNSLDKKFVLIGSHGRTHQNLLQINADDAKKEIIESKKELENILNTPIEAISFPHGGFNQTHVDMAVQAGYRQAYSIEPEQIYCGSGTFLRGRVKADPSDWHIEFCLKLFGAYRWLPKAFAIKKRFLQLLYLISCHNDKHV
ncbi:MAG TPA: polysaccharide deacetylase family protein [Smithella sp.]|nr:polysaccharide deacetylase family protein [Smithella sp.]